MGKWNDQWNITPNIFSYLRRNECVAECSHLTAQRGGQIKEVQRGAQPIECNFCFIEHNRSQNTESNFTPREQYSSSYLKQIPPSFCKNSTRTWKSACQGSSYSAAGVHLGCGVAHMRR